MSHQDLPSRPMLRQLYDVLEKSEISTIFEKTKSSLGSQAENISREDGDEEIIPKLLLRVSEVLVLKGDLWTKDVPKDLRSRIQRGLETIERIDSLSNIPPKADNTFLLRLVACTAPDDPWMTPKSSDIANRLCQRYISTLTSPAFLIDQILKSTIRPLFSKSRPSTITPSARKAMNPSIRSLNEPTDIDPATKPWKFEFPNTIALFRWTVDHSDTNLLTQNWPLYIPPLLTFLDDPTPACRSLATNLLHALLSITPPTLLKQTGLGEVFSEAVFPTLSYLPTLTPTPDSLLLLKPAYTVLYTLADLQYPDSSSKKSSSEKSLFKKDSEVNAVEKQKFYDRILREGVFSGYLYAREDVQILEVLLGELGVLVERMDIESVKHLKQIMPILTNTLLSPFLLPPTIPPSLLLTTLHTTHLLIQNTWPRIITLEHRNPLIHAMCVCWMHVLENERELRDNKKGEVKSNGLDDIKKELKVAASLLVKAMEAVNPGTNTREELAPLLKGGGFKDLFFGDV